MTRIGQTIIEEALTWVERSCKETVRNGGSCIDDLQAAYSLPARREAYCAKFGWVCVDAACKKLGIPNLLPKTAGARDMRDRARKGPLKTDTNMAPGAIFYRYSTAAASGHIGIVLGWNETTMFSAEGNRGDRIDLFENKISSIRNPKNGWEFLHTELMPGGVEHPPQILSSPPPWLALAAVGGAGYFLYRQGAFDKLLR